MIEIETIRKNLQDVKNDYTIMEMYAREYPRSKIIFPKELMKVVKQYDKIMDKTPIHLRLAYINLYRCFKKQKMYAQECGVTDKYIQILHKRIIVYILIHLIRRKNIKLGF